MKQSFANLLKALCVCTGVLSFAFNASAWGQKGHDVTCAVAQKHLSRKAAKKVAEVFDGKSLVYWYIKKYAGVNEVGLPMWYKSDGTTTTTWDNGAYFLCGDPHPDVYGGFGTSLNAHGFDFTVNFLYSVGGQVMDNGYLGLMGVPYAGVSGGNYHKDMLKAWTAENPDTDIPRAVYNDQNINAISDRKEAKDHGADKGGFLGSSLKDGDRVIMIKVFTDMISGSFNVKINETKEVIHDTLFNKKRGSK